MADNVELNAGSGGATTATDEISGVHHQRIKIQHGADGSATDVSTASPLPVMDFDRMVALGLVDGWSHMNAMGERESMLVVTAGEDICRMNELSPASSNVSRLLSPSTLGEQMTVYSEDANDTAAGTGVQEVTIKYIDSNFDQQTAILATNGGSVNTTPTDIVFINDFYASAVGSNGVSEGNIHIHQTGTTSSIYNFIIQGGNKSLVPHRMVPDGHKLVITGWHCEEGQGRRVVFRIRSTDMNGALLSGVYCFKDTCYLSRTTSGWMPLNQVVPARSIVKVTGWSDQAASEGSCAWRGYLVAD